MKNKEYKIYSLSDPITNEVRYIGVTQRTLEQRLYQHVWESKTNRGTHKIHWIRTLTNQNLKPIIKLIEVCTDNNWEEREKYWISFYKNLTNTHQGGAGLIVGRDKSSIDRSAEAHKRKISQFSIYGEHIKDWTSIKEASTELNIRSTQLGNALNKRSKTAGGYCWCYLEDKETFKPDIQHYHSLKNKFIKKKLRVITDTDIEYIFESYSDASRFFKKGESYFSMCIRRKKVYKNSGFKIIENIKD